MDDRFDFILASNEIMKNVDKIEYISGTYKALGQDGNRFNGSIRKTTKHYRCVKFLNQDRKSVCVVARCKEL